MPKVANKFIHSIIVSLVFRPIPSSDFQCYNVMLDLGMRLCYSLLAQIVAMSLVHVAHTDVPFPSFSESHASYG